MNPQLFPEQCGYNVASWWCPLTNVLTLINLLFLGVIVAIIISYIMKNKTRRKEHDNNKI